MNSITHKELTQHVFARKRIRINNAQIITADTKHILGKDLIELYLKLNGCKKMFWYDEIETVNTTSFIANIFNIFKQICSMPFLLLRVRILLKRAQKEDTKVTMPQTPHFLYLRTDHWFNLKSGGSVGHVSGVVNELHASKMLGHLLSSSYLHQVNYKEINIFSPEYALSSNIPNLPEMQYNLQLNTALENVRFDEVNVIYQRYSKGNFNGVLLKHKLGIPLIIEYNGSELWVAKNWNNEKLLFGGILLTIEILNLRHADLIVVVSEALKDELVTRGIKEEHILVNPNGVDVKKYKPQIDSSTIKAALKLNQKNIIGFIGTFGEWHGVKVMAKSIVSLFNTYPERKKDTHFLLIGDGKKDVAGQPWPKSWLSPERYSSSSGVFSRFSKRLRCGKRRNCIMMSECSSAN